jgi:hypothetical protein
MACCNCSGVAVAKSSPLLKSNKKSFMFFGFLVNDFLLITNWFFAAGQNDVIFFTFCYRQHYYYDASVVSLTSAF